MVALLKLGKRWWRMRDPTVNGEVKSEAVIPFAPTQKGMSSNNDDQLDKAGQSILRLLHKAAGVAEENSRHALDTAQKLSQQLRTAENRIAELEAELETHRNRAELAEQWLHKVYTEIEDRFLRQRR
jgi:predicted ribosome quality control (RQC) complex YloA/Tae2 family protein